MKKKQAVVPSSVTDYIDKEENDYWRRKLTFRPVLSITRIVIECVPYWSQGWITNSFLFFDQLNLCKKNYKFCKKKI